jgi:hypothetical protein
LRILINAKNRDSLHQGPKKKQLANGGEATAFSRKLLLNKLWQKSLWEQIMRRLQP